MVPSLGRKHLETHLLVVTARERISVTQQLGGAHEPLPADGSRWGFREECSTAA